MDIEEAIQFLTENAARHDAQLGAIGVRLEALAKSIERHDAQIEILVETAVHHDARLNMVEDAVQKLAGQVLVLVSNIDVLGEHVDKAVDRISDVILMRARDAQSRERDDRIVSITLATLVLDLIYPKIDPRISYGKS